MERQVHSVQELRAGLQALRPGDADAIFYVADAMVTSQADAIIEHARAKRMATMSQETSTVGMGALAAYGSSYREAGRMAAKQIYRVLQGTPPGALPVEQFSRPSLAVNLKTAKALGVTIPRSLVLRADEVIQ